MSGTHAHWGRAFVDGLVEAGRRVVSVNHVGVAGSTRCGRTQFTTGDLAEAQAMALDALGVHEPVDVFGISMGGMTAQELTLRHPERVRSLVLGCTSPGGPDALHMAQADMQSLVDTLERRRRPGAAGVVGAQRLRPLRRGARGRLRGVRRGLEGRAHLLRTLSEQVHAIHAHDAADRLGRIAVPTTVAHGTEDRMLPYPNGVAIAGAIPGATLETFDGAGHLFHWEDPERAVRVARETSARAD